MAGLLYPLLNKIVNNMAPTQTSLGTYITGGILTSSGAEIQLSIPTGCKFPSGTQITGLTFDIVARASSSNGQGIYIIKKTSGSSDAASFTLGRNFTFYNGDNQSKTVTPSMVTVEIHGGTNIFIRFSSGVANFFTGNATNTTYVNNNALAIRLNSISLTTNVSS